MVKMSILPKPVKILKLFSIDIAKKKKKNLKMCIESQKILNNQSNPEKEKHSQRHHNSWFQTILHSYSNENSMILA